MNGTKVPVDYALAAPGICRVTLAVMEVSTRPNAALRQEKLELLMKTAALGL